MSNVPFVFTAMIFFILGSIACHLYKQRIIVDLESAVLAWKFQAELTSERLSNWKCLRPHVGDINNIEDEIQKSLGFTLEELLVSLDKELDDIKDNFGVETDER